ncbi:MAG: L,D-transpeptidase family protein [Gammaproteobacteria bacterium]
MKWIYVNTREQQLFLFEKNALLAQYPVSTAKNGLGEIEGSEKTPRGWHCIEKKIGAGQPMNAVFKGRVPTGEIYSEALAAEHPTRDWILTRILWLAGLEEGKNKSGHVDSYSRYIYIHGSPDGGSFETPSSHGCVRMRNADLLELFEAVDEKTPVFIGDEPAPNAMEYIE